MTPTRKDVEPTTSATDELRCLLDEHGVEYETEDRLTIRYTEWGDWLFSEPLDAKPHTLGAQCELMRIPATPAQAIAATLGPGTCHIEHYDTDVLLGEDYYRCTACHSEIFHHLGYHFCPYCGAKVVDE